MEKVIKMRKILLIIPLFALLLAVPAACAGSFHMDVSGSGNIGFYFINSDASGTIIQGYYGVGTIDYQSTYTDGTLETEIESTGRGRFGTILKPANTWTANAYYLKDGNIVPEEPKSGITKYTFTHSWTTSFKSVDDLGNYASVIYSIN